MKTLLLFFTVVTCGLARPDIGLKLREQGYNYQPPATSYGVPTGSYLPAEGSASQPGGSIATGTSGGSFGSSSANAQTQSFQSGTSYQSEATFNAGGSDANYQTTSGGFGSSGSSFESGSSGSFGSNQNVEISKNVYFFDSPEDETLGPIRIRYENAAPRKNYKIIFIKAPSYNLPKIPEINVQNQNSEKTLVYVLVKKQDEGQEIVIPSAAGIKPSKPEVYFIKYKSQKDAQDQIASIQQGGQSGVSANAVDNDQTFISSIKESSIGLSSNGNTGSTIAVGGGRPTGSGLTGYSEQSSFATSTLENSGITNQGLIGGGYDGTVATTSGQSLGNNGYNYGPAGVSGPY